MADQTIEDYNKKYLGQIKWYGNKASGGEYGFIAHPQLGELFFHKNSISPGQEILSFKENEVVVFQTRPSVSDSQRHDAVWVTLLQNFADTDVLYGEFIDLIFKQDRNNIENAIVKALSPRIAELLADPSRPDKADQVFITFLETIRAHIDSQGCSDLGLIEKLLGVSKAFFGDRTEQLEEIIFPNLTPDDRFFLWLAGLLNTFDSAFLVDYILKSDDVKREKVIRKIPAKEKSEVLQSALSSLVSTRPLDLFNKVVAILRITRQATEKRDYTKILDSILAICSDDLKLDLWLADIHEHLDFFAFKPFVVSLSTKNQRKFLKKVVKYIAEKKVVIELEDLVSLNVIDYDTSIKVQQVSGERLDYSTSIVLNVIQDLSRQIKIDEKKDQYQAQKRIYDLIISQIRSPRDILNIEGYFDKCQGRTYLKRTTSEAQDETGKKAVTFSRERNTGNKPDLHPICDGRLAVDKNTNEAIPADDGGVFWWCANQQCYQTCRDRHSPDDWENYSMQDILQILDVEYKESDYVIYLNLINKANRFLTHLSCRDCKEILRPLKQANYAFHGVNEFHCTNEHCKNRGTSIYLTHCLNGACEHPIDSRDTVKCRPDVADPEKCGWYICNYCHSCCSSEAIERRSYIMEKTGQQYRCHKIGHRNSGVICCDKCGYAMNSVFHGVEEFQTALKWFIDNRDNRRFVLKSGKTKFDKWWFMFANSGFPNEKFLKKLDGLKAMGFNIPDFEDKTREAYLVAEPIVQNQKPTEILYCSNESCSNSINLSTDPERGWAIRRFHNVRFPKKVI